ncbi:major facilitator superfamily domain-containing protein [Dipodascopsis uninucleata]
MIVLGIIQPNPSRYASGTKRLLLEHDADQAPPTGLKTRGNIVLVPQPSDDPNDPLNWSALKKDTALAIICLSAITTTVATPLLASCTELLVLTFIKSFTSVALLTGYHMLAAAIAAIFLTAFSRKFGKRPVYLFALVMQVAGNLWGGLATSYSSLLGARILQGIAIAPFETIINSSVADLYFVHERGTRVAIANLSIFGASFLTPIISGHVAANLGWHWMFWISLIFSAISLVLFIILVPETAYIRASDDQDDQEKSEESSPMQTTSNSTSASTSFLSRLSPYSGFIDPEPLWKLVVRPLPLFLHPSILWACLSQGPMVAWTVMIGVVLAAIFLGPPLWFTEEDVGDMYAGGLVGALLGYIISGVLVDTISKLLSKRSNNTFEPEYRSILLVPQLICAAIGLWGFGYTASDVYNYSKYVPAVFFGFETAAMMFGAIGAAAYITDAFANHQLEAFLCLTVFKNILSFVFIDRCYDWLITLDVRKCFVIIGIVQVVLSVVTMLYWSVGKLVRAYLPMDQFLKYFRL